MTQPQLSAMRRALLEEVTRLNKLLDPAEEHGAFIAALTGIRVLTAIILGLQAAIEVGDE